MKRRDFIKDSAAAASTLGFNIKTYEGRFVSPW
jgi:hypothetical protein